MVKKSATKQQAQKSNKSKLKNTRSTIPQGMASKRALIILFAFFAVVAGWLVVHIARTTYERNQYTHAQANLDALYDDIIAAVGKPDRTKDDASCGYVSQEFGRGARYCDIYKYIAYHLTPAQTNERYEKVVSIIKKSRDVTYEKTLLIQDSDIEKIGLNTAVFNNSGIINCTASFLGIRDTTDKEYASLAGGFINITGLSVRFHCSGGTQGEYFPVKS